LTTRSGFQTEERNGDERKNSETKEKEEVAEGHLHQQRQVMDLLEIIQATQIVLHLITIMGQVTITTILRVEDLHLSLQPLSLLPNQQQRLQLQQPLHPPE
jgi:hypothetical protein